MIYGYFSDQQSYDGFTCDICKDSFSISDSGAVVNTGGFDLNGTDYICPRCANRLTLLLTREINIMKMETAMKSGKDSI